MAIDTVKEEIRYLPGAEIRRGYRFPFGGWLELRHRTFGKFGLLLLRDNGKPNIYTCPILPKVNRGWCSAAEGYYISAVHIMEKAVIIKLRLREVHRMLVFNSFNSGNAIITDNEYRILWLDKRSDGFPIQSVYSPLEEIFSSESVSIMDNPSSRTKLDTAISLGAHMFDEVWNKLIWREIRKKLKRESTSLNRTLRAVRGDYEKLGNPEEIRRLADAIMANLHVLSNRRGSIQITDPYSGDTIDVAIDAAITPAQYAEKLYNRARKAERGKYMVVARYRELLRKRKKIREMNEIDDLEQLTAQLDIDRIRLLGIPASEQGRGKRLDYGSGVKRFKSSDGFEILVGRSADANNRLTFQIASRDDIWLHAEGIKGAHVVIRTAGKQDIPRRTIQEAARIAAFYSSAKHASLVPVIYTKQRYVHSIKGSKGTVRIDRSKTIMAEPYENPMMKSKK